MNTRKVQDVFDELVTTYQNFKAEIFVAEMLENSDVDLSDIDIINKSTFSRSYRRDVIDFKLDTYSSSTDKLQLELARNGLYDTLPEGMFHDTTKPNNTASYRELRQKQKKQEKEARSFFTPLENEFFTQKVYIEQKERTLINEFTNLKTDFLLNFWNLDKDIPPMYSTKLLQLLPYVHRISGDIELTCLSLEKIIEEKVTIQQKYKTVSEHIDLTTSDDRLGINFVSDLKETTISYPYWEITISPSQKEAVDKYAVDDATKKFISIFCDYFIPIEIDTDIKVHYSKNEKTFILHENGPRIGLTTMI